MDSEGLTEEYLDAASPSWRATYSWQYFSKLNMVDMA